MKCQLTRGYIPLFFIVISIFINNEINAQAIKLFWAANPENDIMYYNIYKDITASPQTEIAKVPATDRSYIDNNIVMGKEYYYRITAVDSANNVSEFSDEICILAQNPSSVELISFTAEFINSKIILQWTISSLSNNFNFEIQKSNNGIDFNKIGLVPGLISSTKHYLYSFVDVDISYGKYYYRLKQIDIDGSFKYSNIITTEVGIPEKFELSQNYPNPFNMETTIQYTIAKEGQISLVILNILGREVRKLVDEYQRDGYYTVEWDGKDNAGNKVSSGIYLCQLQSENLCQIRKLMLEK